MDGYTDDFDIAWPPFMADGPIFCAAPSPSSADDIICPGSDDEADEASRIARVQRYEKHGRRYLQGKPLRILSASLRGPFNKTSGWQNPWLPKPSSQNAPCLKDVPQPPLALSATRYESGIPGSRLSSEESCTTEDLNASMDCHLPSPRSHEDLQLSNTPSHSESHSRIQSWANNVPRDILEEDQFWAPNRIPVDSTVQSFKRHSASKDWLKRRPAKRRKVYASQNTDATPIPAPVVTAWPRPQNREASKIEQKSANRSFEMTTPSSSLDQEPIESLDSKEPQPAGPHEDFEQPAYSPITTGSRQEIGGGGGEGEDGIELHEDEEQNTGASEDMHPDEPRRQLSYCNEEPEESVVYENHADDSFCYQTRQLKQSALLATSEAIAAEAPSQHSQFDTTVSSTSDVASIFPNPDIQKSTSNLTHGRSNINNAEHRERADGAFITSNNKTSHPIPATRNPDSSLLQCHEGRSMSCGNIDSIVDTAHMPKFKVGRPLSDITLDECSFRLNISSTVPQTVAEVREAQVTRTESFLDDDPTLIGDQINTEKPADIESTQPILCHDSFVDSSLLQHYAISATNFANTTQLSQCSSVTTVNSENDSTTSATSIIPDAVVAELQPTVNNPAIRSAQGEVTNPVFGTDATLSQVVDGTLQSRATAQTIPIEHQSPWAVQSNSRSNGLAEYEPEESTAQPMATKFDSTPLMHCSPTIRPSQQSPWVMDIAEPLNIITLQGTPPVSTAVIMDIELSKNPQNSMLSTTPSQSTPLPPVLPALSKSRQTPRGDQCIETNTVVEKEGSMPKQILPCTPIPRIPRQSTPEGEVSIRSFSNFNLSSPQRSVHYHGSSRRQTFLSSRTYSNTPTTAKSNRRVSFAPLPHEEDGSNQGSMKSRAASPPPPKLVDPKEEDVDGNYQNHFDIMNRRLSIAGARGLQYHQRLLPSSSQQQPESPSIGAMAEAFQEADAYRLYHANSKVEGAKASEGEAEMVSADIPQSPWQHDSMGIDDVAAVLANLPEFLDVWDVDAEIDKNRVGHDKVKRLEASSNTDMSILQGVGIW